MRISLIATLLAGVVAVSGYVAACTLQEGRCTNPNCTVDTNPCPAGVGKATCLKTGCQYGKAKQEVKYGYCDWETHDECWESCELVYCQDVYAQTQCKWESDSSQYCFCPEAGTPVPGYPKPASCW